MSALISATIFSVEMLALMNISGAFLKRKMEKEKTDLIAIVWSILFIFFFSNLLQWNSIFLKTVTALLSAMLLIISTHYGDIMKIFFATCLFYILIYVVDDVVIMFLMMVLGVSVKELQENANAWCAGIFMAKSMEYWFSVIFQKIYIRRDIEESHSILQWIRFLLFPTSIILTLCLIVFDSIERNEISNWLLLDTFLLMVSSWAIILLEEKISEKTKTERMNEMLLKEMKTASENVEIIRENYRIQRKQTHDFKNHLLTIQMLLKNKEEKEAMFYLNTLIGKRNENICCIHTNHSCIDAILNQKYNEAVKQDIQLEFSLTDLSEIWLTNEELVVIISNLLDNAIHASKDADEKRIQLTIGNTDRELLISVRNTTGEEVEISDNQNVIIKRDNLHHGYGLQNIKGIVERYKGSYALEYKEGWFQFSAIIYQ